MSSNFNYEPSKSSLRADTVVEFVNRSLLDFKMNVFCPKDFFEHVGILAWSRNGKRC